MSEGASSGDRDSSAWRAAYEMMPLGGVLGVNCRSFSTAGKLLISTATSVAVEVEVEEAAFFLVDTLLVGAAGLTGNDDDDDDEVAAPVTEADGGLVVEEITDSKVRCMRSSGWFTQQHTGHSLDYKVTVKL